MEYNSENAQNLLHINGTIKSFEGLKLNDILEINDNLTLQINCILNTGGTNCNLSIDSLICNIYQSMICNINLINPLSLELLQVEIPFKNQYISRGILWKIENDLINKIVHANEYIEYKNNIDVLSNNFNITSNNIFHIIMSDLLYDNCAWIITDYLAKC